MAAVAFVAATAAESTASPITIAVPTGTAAGDVLLAAIHINAQNGNHTFSGPAGWTKLHTVGSGNTYGVTHIYWRVATVSEPASYSWSYSNATYAAGAIAAYRNVSNTAPVDVSAGDWGDLTAPSVDVTNPASMLVGLWGARNNNGTMTPPSGMTKRVENTGTGTSQDVLVADVQLTTSGATGTKTATSTGVSVDQLTGTLVALAPANRAPNAPTNLSPSGKTINRANTNRFSWDFSDPDAGDSQSQYDLRYRLTSSSTWTVVSNPVPNSYHDFAAGTFAAGDYEWQVRTYDAQGAVGTYSASAFFTAADAPAGPSITDPVAGQTISTETYTVVWSTPSQEAYQVRTVADAAGSPDATTVYTDTGEVTSTTARSRSVSFATNNRKEHVQVRVKNSGLWSTWISVNVTVSYTPPATPTVAVDDTSVSGAIAVRASHPTPSGSQPTVTSVDIHRRVTATGGDGIRVAKDLAPTALFIDYAVASGVDFGYRVRAYGDNGTSSWSAWSEAATELAVVYGGGYE